MFISFFITEQGDEMGKVGVYGCCGNKWGYLLNGVAVRPIHMPISEDGASIMAACEICAPDLPATKLAELAREAYVASSEAMPNEEIDIRLGFSRSPQLAEPTAALKAWVLRQHALGKR